MGSSLLQLIALAAIAIYLIVRLRNTLGSRDGFENPRRRMSQPTNVTPIRRDQEEDVEEVDDEIIEHAGSDSGTADALIAMKRVEPEFSIDEFITGARAAYEMILIGFARGEIDDIEPFLSEEVYDSFRETIDARASEGHRCEARFVGLHEAKLESAEFDQPESRAEICMRFVGEVVSYVTDADGEVIEGDPDTVRRQRDSWTFARNMGSRDPNWVLVATG